MRQKILEILAEVVAIENTTEFHEDDKLSDLGLTSILFIQFIVKLEETFSIEILDSDLTLRKFETVESMFHTLQKYFDTEKSPKKVLVCDCDNVLWQGVAGEEELRIGPTEHRIQSCLTTLYQKGVLLCLCSKNEESNIRLAFSYPDMLLSWEHIITFRINRTDKASNLRDMAAELNLSADSFVFVDDSDYELGLVNAFLPEVLTVKADAEGIWINEITDLFGLQSSPEERNRTVLYREQKEREKEKIFFSTVEEYNRSLNTVVSCDLADESVFSRLAELSQRTNQCNLSLARYTTENLRQLAADSSVSVLALSARDKYGDMGVVGGAVLRKKKSAIIESFFLSCRVFERGFEELLLARLRSEAKDLPLKGILRKNEKNKKYHDFYLRNGVISCE